MNAIPQLTNADVNTDLHIQEPNAKSTANKVVKVAIQDSCTRRYHPEMNATRKNVDVNTDLHIQQSNVKSTVVKVVKVAIQDSCTSRNHPEMSAIRTNVDVVTDLHIQEPNVKSTADKVVKVAIQDSCTSRYNPEMNAIRTNADVDTDLHIQEPNVLNTADKVVKVAIQDSRTSRNHPEMNATRVERERKNAFVMMAPPQKVPTALLITQTSVLRVTVVFIYQITLVLKMSATVRMVSPRPELTAWFTRAQKTFAKAVMRDFIWEGRTEKRFFVTTTNASA